MTREEFNDLLTKAANPDTGIEALTSLKESGKELFDTIESLTSKVNDSDKRIRDLQDSNMKLFLKIGTPEKNEPDGPSEEEKLEDEFMSMFNKKED